ncbi:MAG: DUF6662 family protein [Sphingomicrobium sp.]
MSTRILPAVVAAGFAVLCASRVSARPDFGYVYTAGVEEPGETELTLWATDRRGKGQGHYDAQDYRIEVERGITERLQVSAYANFASHHVRGLSGEFGRIDRSFGFQGLSAEFKYQLQSPEKGRLGIALYAEPDWSRISRVTGGKADEYELELKAIVQKNFLADRLVWAANVTLEPEWEREHEEIAPGIISRETKRELAIEASTGVAYRVAPRLWLGAEGRYHSVYPDWTHGLHRENYAVYGGPTAHYDGGKWSLTATWLPQLVGSPGPGSSSLELEDHEKNELRVKLSYEF